MQNECIALTLKSRRLFLTSKAEVVVRDGDEISLRYLGGTSRALAVKEDVGGAGSAGLLGGSLPALSSHGVPASASLPPLHGLEAASSLSTAPLSTVAANAAAANTAAANTVAGRSDYRNLGLVVNSSGHFAPSFAINDESPAGPVRGAFDEDMQSEHTVESHETDKSQGTEKSQGTGNSERSEEMQDVIDSGALAENEGESAGLDDGPVPYWRGRRKDFEEVRNIKVEILDRRGGTDKQASREKDGRENDGPHNVKADVERSIRAAKRGGGLMGRRTAPEGNGVDQERGKAKRRRREASPARDNAARNSFEFKFKEWVMEETGWSLRSIPRPNPSFSWLPPLCDARTGYFDIRKGLEKIPKGRMICVNYTMAMYPETLPYLFQQVEGASLLTRSVLGRYWGFVTPHISNGRYRTSYVVVKTAGNETDIISMWRIVDIRQGTFSGERLYLSPRVRTYLENPAPFESQLVRHAGLARQPSFKTRLQKGFEELLAAYDPSSVSPSPSVGAGDGRPDIDPISFPSDRLPRSDRVELAALGIVDVPPLVREDLEKFNDWLRTEIRCLQQKIIRQLNFYFSPRNLAQDYYLSSLLNRPENATGVPLKYVSSFNRMKDLCLDYDTIKDACAREGGGRNFIYFPETDRIAPMNNFPDLTRAKALAKLGETAKSPSRDPILPDARSGPNRSDSSPNTDSASLGATTSLTTINEGSIATEEKSSYSIAAANDGRESLAAIAAVDTQKSAPESVTAADSPGHAESESAVEPTAAADGRTKSPPVETGEVGAAIPNAPVDSPSLSATEEAMADTRIKAASEGIEKSDVAATVAHPDGGPGPEVRGLEDRASGEARDDLDGAAVEGLEGGLGTEGENSGSVVDGETKSRMAFEETARMMPDTGLMDPANIECSNEKSSAEEPGNEDALTATSDLAVSNEVSEAAVGNHEVSQTGAEADTQADEPNVAAEAVLPAATAVAALLGTRGSAEACPEASAEACPVACPEASPKEDTEACAEAFGDQDVSNGVCKEADNAGGGMEDANTETDAETSTWSLSDPNPPATSKAFAARTDVDSNAASQSPCSTGPLTEEGLEKICTPQLDEVGATQPAADDFSAQELHPVGLHERRAENEEPRKGEMREGDEALDGSEKAKEPVPPEEKREDAGKEVSEKAQEEERERKVIRQNEMPPLSKTVAAGERPQQSPTPLLAVAPGMGVYATPFRIKEEKDERTVKTPVVWTTSSCSSSVTSCSPSPTTPGMTHPPHEVKRGLAAGLSRGASQDAKDMSSRATPKQTLRETTGR